MQETLIYLSVLLNTNTLFNLQQTTVDWIRIDWLNFILWTAPKDNKTTDDMLITQGHRKPHEGKR